MIDEKFKGMLKLKQSGESKVMCCPSCEDSADHSTRSLATFFLDVLQLGKNICLAPQPGYKLARCFTVLDICCLDGKVVPDDKINLPCDIISYISLRTTA